MAASVNGAARHGVMSVVEKGALDRGVEHGLQPRAVTLCAVFDKQRQKRYLLDRWQARER